MTELTVKLPDELARQVRAAGLLDEAALEEVFRDALRKQAVGEAAAFVTDDPAFGIWRDREEAADVEALARRLRAPRYRRDGTRNEDEA